MDLLARTVLEPLAAAAGAAVVGVSVDGRRELAPLGTADGTSVFRIASLTKPVTAVATVRAAERAGVRLETPVLQVLPELEDDWAADRGLTIAQALSQTSGLAPTVTADDVAALGAGDEVVRETARLVVRAGSVRGPGERWEYYNGNYFLAGAILAELHGTSYERAVDELVLRPAGMTATSFAPGATLVPGAERGRPVPAPDYPRGRRPSGGLCTGAPDLLAYAEHLLADQDLLAQVAEVRTRPADPVRYGLGWAVGPSGQLYLNGRLAGYRAAFLLVPDHRLAAVALAADTEPLPAAARVLSELQRDLTGDDLAGLIDSFAA